MVSSNLNPADSERTPGALTQGLAAAAGAGVGALVGDGAAGAMIGAAAEPQLAVLLQRFMQELGGLRARSATKMLGDAAIRLDRSPDEMVTSALAEPFQAQLLGDAIQAAARTMNEEKLRALSRALANGLANDKARLDEEALVLGALAEIDTPHIKVLIELGPERRRARTTSSNLRGRTAPSRGRSTAALGEACNMTEPAARAALSVLQRAGLAVQDDTAEIERYDRLIMELQAELNKLVDLTLRSPKDGKIPSGKKPRHLDRPGSPSRVGWYITSFGFRCLAYLQDYDEAETADEAEGPTRRFDYPESDQASEPLLTDLGTETPNRFTH